MPLTFDYNKLLFDIEAQLKQLAISNVPAITNATQTYLNDATERLTTLANTYAEDQDNDFLELKLKEESPIFENILASYEIMGEQVAEDAKQQTLQTILTTILNAIAGMIINDAS